GEHPADRQPGRAGGRHGHAGHPQGRRVGLGAGAEPERLGQPVRDALVLARPSLHSRRHDSAARVEWPGGKPSCLPGRARELRAAQHPDQSLKPERAMAMHRFKVNVPNPTDRAAVVQLRLEPGKLTGLAEFPRGDKRGPLKVVAAGLALDPCAESGRAELKLRIGARDSVDVYAIVTTAASSRPAAAARTSAVSSSSARSRPLPTPWPRSCPRAALALRNWSTCSPSRRVPSL